MSYIVNGKFLGIRVVVPLSESISKAIVYRVKHAIRV